MKKVCMLLCFLMSMEIVASTAVSDCDVEEKLEEWLMVGGMYESPEQCIVPEDAKQKLEVTKKVAAQIQENPYATGVIESLIREGIVPDQQEYCGYAQALLQTFEDAIKDPQYDVQGIPEATLIVLLEAGCDPRCSFKDTKTGVWRPSLLTSARAEAHPKDVALQKVIETWEWRKERHKREEEIKKYREYRGWVSSSRDVEQFIACNVILFKLHPSLKRGEPSDESMKRERQWFERTYRTLGKAKEGAGSSC